MKKYEALWKILTYPDWYDIYMRFNTKLLRYFFFQLGILEPNMSPFQIEKKNRHYVFN